MQESNDIENQNLILGEINQKILAIDDIMYGLESDQPVEAFMTTAGQLDLMADLLSSLSMPQLEVLIRSLRTLILTIYEKDLGINRVVFDYLREGLGLVYRHAINNEPYSSRVVELAERVDSMVMDIREVGAQALSEDEEFVTVDDVQGLDQVLLFGAQGDSLITFSNEAVSPTSTPKPPAAPAAPAEPPRLKQRGRYKLRILIVDDNLNNRIVLRSIVSGFGVCDEVVNGEEALEAFVMAHSDGTPYDVIFLDIMMPVMDGHEALKLIRRKERELGLPFQNEALIVMVTALGRRDAIKAFFRGHCTDYIQKPYTRERVLAFFEEYGLL